MLSSFSPLILAAFPDLSSMADKKMSTIIMEVDLNCSRCFKKITETLEKYPEIQTQILHREKKTITISGPFDPEKLMKCICCKAGKYIKSYKIVKPPPQPSPPPPPPLPPPPPPPLPPPPTPPPPCRCCKCCRCCHGWAAQPCMAPICVCLCFDGYKAVPWWSPYPPPCGWHGEESTCWIM